MMLALLILGGAWIVYMGRPVMKQKAQVESPQGTTATEKSASSFSMDDVAAHGAAGDCWTAINGSVYDLTTWVSRHPGGSSSIIRLCGKDGSAAFEREHGSESRPIAALMLLKIGSLK